MSAQIEKIMKYINHFAILVDGSPQIMLFPVDFHEHLIDEECITETSMFSLQAAGIDGTQRLILLTAGSIIEVQKLFSPATRGS